MIEVVGGNVVGDAVNPPDLVVPTEVLRNTPAAGPCPMPAGAFLDIQDIACESRPLSGTDPLARAMNLEVLEISPPYAAGMSQPADTVIRFTAGDHSSILTPFTTTDDVDATAAAQTNCEMQRQTARFLGDAADPLVAAPEIPIGPTTCP